MNKITRYKIVTITHKEATLKEVGAFAVPISETVALQNQLQTIKVNQNADELLYLNTCNRILFLFSSDHQIDFSQLLMDINPALNPDKIKQFKFYEGQEALNHLYQVGASIDSLVVGEREILRQLREAYTKCKTWQLTGDDIRLLMRFVVEASKKVYAQTRIGEKPISVVSLAIQNLLRFNPPKDARFLLVGAGQTNTLVAKFLVKHQFSNITVFNRSLAKAKIIANMLKGDALELNELAHYKKGFDILIVCTASQKPIITNQLYQQLLQGEAEQKILIDLAIPNNIDAAVVKGFNNNYIEIEDLRSLAKENLAFREQEVEVANNILVKEIEAFELAYQQRQLEKAMQAIPQQIKKVKKRAIDEVFQKEIALLDDNTKELLDRVLSYMEKKCISIPMTVAKQTIRP